MGWNVFGHNEAGADLDVVLQVSSQIVDDPYAFIVGHSSSIACEKCGGGAGAWPLCVPAFAFSVTNCL
jgi:hypothetical protein